MYGKSWSCPPAVGTVDACRARCLAYPEALLVVTVQEVADSADLATGLATKPFHNRQVQAVRQLLQAAPIRPPAAFRRSRRRAWRAMGSLSALWQSAPASRSRRSRG